MSERSEEFLKDFHSLLKKYNASFALEDVWDDPRPVVSFWALGDNSYEEMDIRYLDGTEPLKGG